MSESLGRVTAVTCMKNEGPFILEWIAWNRMIGVTDFLVYTNDCTDGTDALLDALAPAGVHHLPNPAQPGEPYQMTALKHAPQHPSVAGAEWVFVTDVDEFLHISAGDGSLAALVAACGTPKAISVTMRMMANGGVADFDDRPVIAQFTRTHPADQWGEDLAIEVKTLTHRDFPLRFYGAHRPFVSRRADPASVHWTDGSGRQVPEAFATAAMRRRRHRFRAAGARGLATLNHYTLRSLDSYLVKSERGDVNRVHRHFRLRYWVERNDDSVEEASILSRLPALEAEMAALRALPGVAAAHEACVAHHRAAIARLRADPVYAALRAELVEASVALGGSGTLPEMEPEPEEEEAEAG